MPTLTINQINTATGKVEPKVIKSFVLAIAGRANEVEIICFDEKNNILFSIANLPDVALQIASHLASAAGFAQAQADKKAGAVPQEPGVIH